MALASRFMCAALMGSVLAPSVLWTSGCECGMDDGGWPSATDTSIDEGIDLPVDDRPTIIASPPPPPITGGGIVVLSDGRTAVVTDPDRDLVHVIDVDAGMELETVELATGSWPTRLARDSDGTVHVVLRGTGEIASLDPQTGSIRSTRAVCRNPRDVTFAPSQGVLLVACAGGDVWHLRPDEGAAARHAVVEPDLRDVIVAPDGTIRVTRFRSAEVLTLGDGGKVVSRRPAQDWPDPSDLAHPLAAHVAWRTIGLPDGGWLMVHQGSGTKPIDLSPPEPAVTPYGGVRDVADGPEPCSELVQSTVFIAYADGSVMKLGSVANLSLPVDVAADIAGSRIAIAGAGTCGEDCSHAAVFIVDGGDFDSGAPGPTCGSPFAVELPDEDPQVIAVAFLPDGRLLAHAREPTRLHVIEADGRVSDAIDLAGRSVEDTGHRLFHESGVAGVSCASCHPEGTDDGHVWSFGAPRHTPALDVGLSGTEPFHTRGELEDFAALVREVHQRRMGGPIEPDDRIAALEAWIFGLRAIPPRAEQDELASTGAALFSNRGCATCHAGDATTKSESVSIADAPSRQIPSLHGVALHPPYMFDGRAATLTDAVEEMLATAENDAPYDGADIDAIVAYLQTL